MSPKLGHHTFIAALIIGSLAATSGCKNAGTPVRTVAASADTWSEEAARRGLIFQHSTGVPRHLNILQATGSGGGFIDYDNDGAPDIYLVQGDTRTAGSGKLFHNRGDGTFEDVSASSGIRSTGFGQGVAVGDYDGDGRDDLFLANYGQCQLYRNLGGGRFREVSHQAGADVKGWAVSAAFLDADRDGDLDLYVTRYARFGPNERQLCFPEGVPTSCTPKHYGAQPDAYLENIGKGRFREATAAAGFKDLNGRTLGIALADFNDDGTTDLLLTNDGTANSLWEGDGRGHFRDQATLSGIAYNALGKPTASMGVAVGDINGDGRQDAFIGNFQNEPDTVFLNQGLAFVESSAALGLAEATLPTLTFGVALVDWDNDGRLDTLQANGHVQDRIAEIDALCSYRQPRQFFRQGPDGVFIDRSGTAGEALSHAEVSRCIATGDVDNDGRVDALVTTTDGPARLLMNRAPAARWLKVDLKGPRGNPRGLGARVTCSIGNMRRVVDVSASAGFEGACDPRVNVGLGNAAGPTQIEVRWPDGTRSRKRDVAPDQIVKIEK